MLQRSGRHRGAVAAGGAWAAMAGEDAAAAAGMAAVMAAGGGTASEVSSEHLSVCRRDSMAALCVVTVLICLQLFLSPMQRHVCIQAAAAAAEGEASNDGGISARRCGTRCIRGAF